MDSVGIQRLFLVIMAVSGMDVFAKLKKQRQIKFVSYFKLVKRELLVEQIHCVL